MMVIKSDSHLRLGLIAGFLLLFACSAKAQQDTLFWFAAPDVTRGHTDRPIFLRLSTDSIAASVRVRMPADPLGIDTTVNLSTFDVSNIDLTPYIDRIEPMAPDTILPTGILITATAQIGAYYEVKSRRNNTDIFSLKGQNALGKEFLIPFQKRWNTATKYRPQAYSGLEILATRNGTLITIDPSANVVGHGKLPFSFIMNEGETYSLRATSLKAKDRLSGSLVTSNKPIAITLTDDSAENGIYGGCKDLMGDQLIPARVIGREYVVVRGRLNKRQGIGDQIIIMAHTDTTDIYVNGAYQTQLQRGQQYSYALNANAAYVEASNKVYVTHLTGFGCETGTAAIPALYCTGSNYVSFTRSKTEDFFLLVMAPSNIVDHFTLNNSIILLQGTDFKNVPGTGGQWKYCFKKYNNTDVVTGSASRLDNSKGFFHMGIINGGRRSGTMYGFFSNFYNVKTGPIYHLETPKPQN